MNRNTKQFSTQALLAAGALAIAGVATTSPSFAEKPAGYEQANRSEAQVQASDDRTTVNRDATPDTNRHLQSQRAENVAKGSPQLDFTGYSESQSDWNDQQQSRLDNYVQQDEQRLDGRIVNATSYLTNGDADSPTSPKAFLSDDNQLYMLIQTDDVSFGNKAHHSARGDMEHATDHHAKAEHHAKSHDGDTHTQAADTKSDSRSQMDRTANAANAGDTAKDAKSSMLCDLSSNTRVSVEGRVVERSGMKAILVDSLWTESEMSDSAAPGDDAQSSIK